MSQEEKYEQLNEFITKKVDEEENIRELSVVKKAEEIFGGVSKDIQTYIAKKLNISDARVRGIMKYNRISETRKGKNHISVCMGTSCGSKCSREILALIEEELGIKKGEITDDELFSIDTTGCIKYCVMAPIVTINGKVYSQVKIDEISDILKRYRK